MHPVLQLWEACAAGAKDSDLRILHAPVLRARRLEHNPAPVTRAFITLFLRPLFCGQVFRKVAVKNNDSQLKRILQMYDFTVYEHKTKPNFRVVVGAHKPDYDAADYKVRVYQGRTRQDAIDTAYAAEKRVDIRGQIARFNPTITRPGKRSVGAGEVTPEVRERADTTYADLKTYMRRFVLTYPSNAEGLKHLFTAALTLAREGGIPDSIVQEFSFGYQRLTNFADALGKGGAK